MFLGPPPKRCVNHLIMLNVAIAMLIIKKGSSEVNSGADQLITQFKIPGKGGHTNFPGESNLSPKWCLTGSRRLAGLAQKAIDGGLGKTTDEPSGGCSSSKRSPEMRMLPG